MLGNSLYVPKKNIILPQITLRPYQHKPFEDFFIKKKKRVVRIIHRRAGKDTEAIQFVHMAALQRPGLYLYLLPKINQARTVVWEGRGKDGRKLMNCIPKHLIKKDHQTTMTRYLKNGSIIKVGGADNYEVFIGSNPLGLVLSEYPICHPNAWQYLRPILSENDGWAWFPYTPRGMNHGYDLYTENVDNPDWSVSKLSVNDTFLLDGSPAVTQDKIEAERRAGMPEALVQQEYYCSFEAAVLGAYFGDEMKACRATGRILCMNIEQNLPVYTSWDIGVGDKTAITLWQPNSGKLNAIYYFEGMNKGIEYYAEELAKIKRKLGFRSWGKHFVPHDIKVREWGSEARTRMAIARGFGIKMTKVKQYGVADGIQAIRTIFPRIHFHESNSKLLVKAMVEYHSEFDFKKKKFGIKAVHDWTSHPVDSVRYFAVGWLDSYDKPKLRQAIEYARRAA